MNAPVGRWRATYTPGRWVVLAGPTSVVVLEPVTPQWSSLVSTLWDEVVGSSSITDLASQLALYRIDTMPSFGAFFWTEDGMRSLVRGAVSVVDLATGSVVADGDGIQTWTEVGLNGVRRIRVELPVDAVEERTPLELPLVIGAVRAASFTLDGSDAAQLVSPQLVGARSGEESQTEDGTVDQGGGLSEGDVDDQSEGDFGDQPYEAQAWDDEEPVGPVTQAMTEPFPPLEAETQEAGADEADTEEVETEEAEEDEPDSAESGYEDDASQASSPPMDPDLLAAIENGDTQLMLPPVPPVAEPAAGPPLPAGLFGEVEPTQALSQDSLIMAVVCRYGHSSPQNATACRVCGSPIDPQGPRLVPRPPLAVLRASNGSTADVDRAVLIGRAPAANRSTARAPRLLTVPSPSHDISRTHLEVAPEGWQVVVTDLRSTNGTVLIRPGSGERQQLPSGESLPVPVGTVMELGDGVSILVDFPQ